MNVTLDFGPDEDGLDTLKRAVAFATELRSMGFAVVVNGSLNIGARWIVAKPAADPKPKEPKT